MFSNTHQPPNAHEINSDSVGRKQEMASGQSAAPIIIESPEGRLDAANAQRFKSLVVPQIEPGSKLIFDMGKTIFVDSAGLGAIVWCLRQVHAAGGELKLCSMAKPVRALFELVRMHKVFEIYNTREEALRSFES